MMGNEDFVCNRCGVGFHYYNYAYVVDDKGTRVFCPPPDPMPTARNVLGKGLSDDAIRRRIGINESFYCKRCLNEVVLDEKKDQMVCLACRSRDLARTSDLVGRRCPKCKKGTIEENTLGESTPVP
ncbi:MAG TPA: hypothetical protein VKM55_25550 [Candidatus Lokiarchaeia archaeon]|nr:hypothetical protein [Candidatus Lokiarchaeia archaeon]